jgi:hypothetical protein
LFALLSLLFVIIIKKSKTAKKVVPSVFNQQNDLMPIVKSEEIAGWTNVATRLKYCAATELTPDWHSAGSRL